MHHWNTPSSPSSAKPKLLACNCRDLRIDCAVKSPPTTANRSYAPRRASLPPTATAYSSEMRTDAISPYGHSITSSPSYTTAPSPTPNYHYQSPEAYQASLSPQGDPRQIAGQRSAKLVHTSSGPINISRGAYRTEARSIFISNLPYNVQRKDLEALLKTCGTLVEFDLRPHKKTQGYTQGSASASFASREEARRARDRLNDYDWNGRRISVRFDKETTRSDPINESEPIVVNGSGRGL